MKNITFLNEKLIAHRGIFDNKRIYENTISAFTRAIKYGYPIELDLRMLKDGTIICFHDDDMQRMLHVEGNIDDLTYEELTYMSRYQIPLFEDVLKLVNGVVPLVIETISITKKHKLEIEICRLLDEYPGLFVIQSFHKKHLKWFKKNKPHYLIGYLIGKRNFKKPIAFKKCDFLNIKIGLYDDKHIRKLKEDYFVIGWGIETTDDLKSAKQVYNALVCDNLLDITNES